MTSLLDIIRVKRNLLAKKKRLMDMTYFHNIASVMLNIVKKMHDACDNIVKKGRRKHFRKEPTIQ